MSLRPEPGDHVDIALSRDKAKGTQLVGRFKFTQVDHDNDDYLMHLVEVRREKLAPKFEESEEVLDGDRNPL